MYMLLYVYSFANENALNVGATTSTTSSSSRARHPSSPSSQALLLGKTEEARAVRSGPAQNFPHHLASSNRRNGDGDGDGSSSRGGAGPASGYDAATATPADPSIWLSKDVIFSPTSSYAPPPNSTSPPSPPAQTWECVGTGARDTAPKPFATEAGPAAAVALASWAAYSKAMLRSAAELPALQEIVVTEAELCVDASRALVGIRSGSFDVSGAVVRPVAGLRLQLGTATSTARVAALLAKIGTSFHRLELYVEWATGPTCKSQVCAALGGSVRLYLDRVQVAVGSLASGEGPGAGRTNGKAKSLAALYCRTQRVGRQLRYLATLCGVDAATPPGGSSSSGAITSIHFQLSAQPRGLALIKKLYTAACDTVDLPYHSLVCGLFLATTKPFLRFLEEWVWDGTLSDPCREFGIDLDPEALATSDATHWEQGVRLEENANWPDFMRSSIAELVNCGKSILLLRRCAPTHFLADKKLPAPKLRLSFLPDSIRHINQEVGRYANKLAGLAEAHANMLDAAAHNTEQRLIEKHLAAVKKAKSIDRRRAADRALQAARADDVLQAGRSNADAGRTVALDTAEALELAVADEAAADAAEKAQQALERRKIIDQVVEQTESEYAAKESALQVRERLVQWKHKRAALNTAREAFLTELEAAEAYYRGELGLGATVLTPTARTAAADAGVAGGAAGDGEGDGAGAGAGDGTGDERNLASVDNIGWVSSSVDAAPSTAGIPQTPAPPSETPAHAHALGAPVSPRTARKIEAATPTNPRDETISGLLYPEASVSRPDMVALLASEPRPNPTLETPAGKTRPLSATATPDQTTPGPATPQSPGRGQIGGSDMQSLLYPEASPAPAPAASPPPQAHQVPPLDPDAHGALPLPPALLASEEGNDQTASTPAGRASNTPKGGSQAASVIKDLLYPATPAPKPHEGGRGDTGEVALAELSPPTMKTLIYPETPDASTPALTTNQDLLSPFASPPPGGLGAVRMPAAGRPSDVADYTDASGGMMKGLIYPTAQDDEDDGDDGDEEEDGNPESGGDVDQQQGDGADAGGGDGNTAGTAPQQPAAEPGDVWNTPIATFGDDLPAIETAIAEAPSFHINLLDTLRNRVGLTSLRPSSDAVRGDTADANQDYLTPNGSGTSAFVTTPPSVVVERCIRVPLQYQARVVNTAVVEYFFEEISLMKHLAAVRKFVLLGSGEWAAAMVGGLCSGIANAEKGRVQVGKIATSMLLQDALVTSRQLSDPFAKCLSFSVSNDSAPAAVELGAIQSLDFVSLIFTPDWPVNVLLNPQALQQYGLVFRLLLRVKRTVWALHDVHTRLQNECPGMDGAGAEKYRQLQSARHEMQHFVTVLATYVSHQVLDVSWAELQSKMKAYREQPAGVDGLIQIHQEYLASMITRSFLNEKGAPIMKMVTSILGLVLKFRAQITDSPTNQSDSIWSDQETFNRLMQTYSKFKEYAQFLHTVTTKLVERGFQDHLQFFLLQLDFNGVFTRRFQEQAEAKAAAAAAGSLAFPGRGAQAADA